MVYETRNVAHSNFIFCCPLDDRGAGRCRNASLDNNAQPFARETSLTQKTPHSTNQNNEEPWARNSGPASLASISCCKLQKTHGIGLRDGFLLQWYWMNFGWGLVAFNPCFKKELDEMNFRCVTSFVSKSYQPASARIRCNKNFFPDAPNRSISYYFLFKECHFLSSQGARTQRMKSIGTSASVFHLVQYQGTGVKHEFAGGANDKRACSLHLPPGSESSTCQSKHECTKGQACGFHPFQVCYLKLIDRKIQRAKNTKGDNRRNTPTRLNVSLSRR